MHRLELTHPFAAIPLVGGRYRFTEEPMSGSIHSLLKATHQRTSERHRALLGANTRFVSDLSDLESNYAVLAGGQDGWFNSSTFIDQVQLFLARAYRVTRLDPGTR